MRFIAIGEIIFDIFEGDAEIGGAPLNFCAHSAGLGAETALISAVGEDRFAEVATEKLTVFGVKTDFISKNSFPTGQCIVTVKNGNPSYDVISPAAYDYIHADICAIKEFHANLFAFGTLIQRNKSSEALIEKILSECEFNDIFCDINLRKNCYNKSSCFRCLNNATILKLSDEEEPLLHKYGFYSVGKTDEETVKNICDSFKNIRIILLTKGENGSVVYSAQEEKTYYFDAEKVDAVSTVGAGDSYSAAFLCEFLKSGNIQKAGAAGAKLSAFVAAHREAVPENSQSSITASK